MEINNVVVRERFTWLMEHLHMTPEECLNTIINHTFSEMKDFADWQNGVIE